MTVQQQIAGISRHQQQLPDRLLRIGGTAGRQARFGQQQPRVPRHRHPPGQQQDHRQRHRPAQQRPAATRDGEHRQHRDQRRNRERGSSGQHHGQDQPRPGRRGQAAPARPSVAHPDRPGDAERDQWQQQVRQHGADPARTGGDQQRRGGGPGQPGPGPQRPGRGDHAGRQPGGEGGQRHAEHGEQQHRGAGRAERQPEHRQHGAQRIGESRGAQADLSPAGAAGLPQRADLLGHRQQVRRQHRTTTAQQPTQTDQRRSQGWQHRNRRRDPGCRQPPTRTDRHRLGLLRHRTGLDHGVIGPQPAGRLGPGCPGPVLDLTPGFLDRQPGGLLGPQVRRDGVPTLPDHLTWRRVQPADGPNRHHPTDPDPAAGPQPGRRADQHADQGSELVGRPVGLLEGEPAERPQRRGDHGPEQDERQHRRRRAGQPQVQGIPPVGPRPGRPAGPTASAGGGRFRVRHHGRRHHHHPVPGQMRAPAEVEVVAGVGERRVRPAEVVPDVPAHQHPGGRDRQHVAAVVELALVDVVEIDAGDPFAEQRRGEPDLDQAPLVVPADLLAAQHGGGRRGVGGVEQPGQGVRSGCGVVVQQPDPLPHQLDRLSRLSRRGRRGRLSRLGRYRRRLLDRRGQPGSRLFGPLHGAVVEQGQGRLDGIPERRPPGQPQQPGHPRGEQIRAGVPRAGVHRHQGVRGPGLAVQRIQGAAQESVAVMADQDRGDRRAGRRTGRPTDRAGSGSRAPGRPIRPRTADPGGHPEAGGRAQVNRHRTGCPRVIPGTPLRVTPRAS